MVELGSQAHAASPFAIFTSPREAFIGVREKPRPAIFVILMAVLALLPAIGFVTNVDAEQVLMKQMRASGQWDQMPDEQREQVKKFGPKMITIGAPVGAVAKRLAWIFVVALLGWAMLRTGASELKYGPCVAAIALACAPLVIADALTCATFFLRDPRTLDVANPIHSNPAAWLSLDAQTSALGAALKRLDLFELWNVALSALGLTVIAQRRSWFAWLAPGGVYLGLWITDIIGGIVGQAQAG